MEDFVVYDKFGNENKNNSGKNMYNSQYKPESESASILDFEDALAMVSYPKYILEFIKKFLIDNYANNDMTDIFMISNKDGDNIFVIEYKLVIELNNRYYKIFVLVYLPILFPNYPPDIFIEKTSKIELNKYYLNGKIDPLTFQINLDNFVKFDPDINNIGEIIDSLVVNFTQEFPVYKSNDKSNPNDWKNSGKCVLDKTKANKVKLPNNHKSYSNSVISSYNFNHKEKSKFDNVKAIKLNDGKKSTPFNDETFLKFIRNQTKDIVINNYVEFNQKYNIKENFDKLKHLEKEAINNLCNDDMTQKNKQLKLQVESLKNIKIKLQDIEKKVEQDCKDCENNNKKNLLEKIDNVITIPDAKNMEYLIKIKVIEEYLVYLKKAFEKKIIGFDEMLNLNRSLSREIFYLNYARSKLQK